MMGHLGILYLQLQQEYLLIRQRITQFAMLGFANFSITGDIQCGAPTNYAKRIPYGLIKQELVLELSFTMIEVCLM